jgi:nucleotide-binding universal stress UspA family protein
MLNFNLIVVTTDLSDYSLRALPYAVGLAERFDAGLKILCVKESTLPISDISGAPLDLLGTDEAVLAEARSTLEKIIDERVPRGVDAEATVLRGDAVDCIVDFARDIHADLLVMCTHGRRGLSHALMGSTAEAVVRKASCPVLMLRQPMPVGAFCAAPDCGGENPAPPP